MQLDVVNGQMAPAVARVRRRVGIDGKAGIALAVKGIGCIAEIAGVILGVGRVVCPEVEVVASALGRGDFAVGETRVEPAAVGAN